MSVQPHQTAWGATEACRLESDHITPHTGASAVRIIHAIKIGIITGRAGWETAGETYLWVWCGRGGAERSRTCEFATRFCGQHGPSPRPPRLLSWMHARRRLLPHPFIHDSNMVHPRPLPTSTICWRCQWHLTNQRRGITHRTLRRAAAAKAVARPPRRALHASRSVMHPYTSFRHAC
jgi:hypothetical protein